MYNEEVEILPASWAVIGDGPKALDSFTKGSELLRNGNSNGRGNGRNGGNSLPPSFLEGKAVRTVYGLVPLKFALDWPIFASYDELSTCAAWMGGRIPTFEETPSIVPQPSLTKWT